MGHLDSLKLIIVEPMTRVSQALTSFLTSSLTSSFLTFSCLIFFISYLPSFSSFYQETEFLEADCLGFGLDFGLEGG